MSTRIQELYSELEVDPNTPSEEGIGRLKNYCQDNISRDCFFEGSLGNRFNSYIEITKQYVELVLPNLHEDDVNHAVEAFGDQSSLEYLVRQGFDRCVERLKPPHEALDQCYGLMSPLHIAAIKGYVHMTDVLLSLGANPRIKNEQEELPMHYALTLPIVYQQRLPELKQKVFIKLFKVMPECLSLKTADGENVVHQMAIYGFGDLLTRVIEKRPESIMMTDNRGLMPIHYAILNNQPEMTKIFIAIGKSSEMLDGKGRSPLHYAASDGSPSMISLCLEGMSDVIDVRDKYKRTPLMLAAYNGKLENVCHLLELGADPDLTDHHKTTALQMAINHYHIDIADHLIEQMSEELVTDEQKQALITMLNVSSNK